MSPVDNAAEVAALAGAGADELYGGYSPSGWVKRYSLLGSANHRYFAGAQFFTASELKKAVKEAHSRGLRFYLTMNAPSYSREQYDGLVTEAERCRDMGIDALIVADIGLMLRLRELVPEMPLHLSTLAPVFNSRTAALYAGLGLTRQVLPRELTVAETKRIIKNTPGVEFDVFVMIGKCPNVEGFCSFTHNNPELIWPCEEKYDISPIRSDGKFPSIRKAASGWSGVNRRQACGLCAIPGLMEAGVTGLKLVGRGGPTKMKVSVIKATREAVGMAASGKQDAKFAARCRKIYKETFGGPCNGYVCYFPNM